jgi:hypothetical protein
MALQTTAVARRQPAPTTAQPPLAPAPAQPSPAAGAPLFSRQPAPGDALAATLARAVEHRATMRAPILQRDWWTDLKDSVSTTVLTVTGTEAEQIEFEHEKLAKRLPLWPDQSRRDVEDRLELLPPAGRATERTRMRAVVDVLGAPGAMQAQPRAADLLLAGSLAQVIAILVSAGCDPSASFRLARGWSLVLKNLLEPLVVVAPITADQISKVIAAASEGERQAAWRDRGLMDRVRDADPSGEKDLYLHMLPALGMMAPSMPGSTGEKARISPQEIDRHIRAYLPTIGQSVPSSRTVIGQLSIVDEVDFQWAYERQWINPGTHLGLAPLGKDQCRAFVDVDLPDRHIWISADRAAEGTPIHEGMHKYASDNVRNAMRTFKAGAYISMLDEGMTEYFTRKLCAARGLTRTPGYIDPHDTVERLAAAVTRPVIANAYYQGSYDELVKAYEKKQGTNTWPAFATALEEGRYGDAQRLIP